MTKPNPQPVPLCQMTDEERETLLRDFYTRERAEDKAAARRAILCDILAPVLGATGLLLFCVGAGAVLALLALSWAGWRGF
jgi:hypothetical protein